MSLLLGSLEPIYLNDGETEGPYLSEDKNEDYNFKYVPADRFKYIVKDVHRQRCREEEESIWASFVKQQELAYYKNSIQPSVQNIKELLDEGMKEADKELERLEADILSDRIEKERRCSQKKRSKVNNVRGLPLKKVPITKDSGTDSTNLLLTIPEEGKVCKKKSDPEHFKLYARKSCSSHAIVRKRQSSKQLLHSTNGVEYNSSPEISTNRDATTANGVIYTRPDPFTMHKILTIQRKVCELLDEIAFRLGNIPAPDGIKDMQKRQQCVAEFVVRFSRNYLYDLERYVKDIRRHMCVISPRARIKPNHRSLGLHMHAIEQKLLAAHQLLLHALIAYCKHIPSSILKGHPGKFREVLQVVVDLKTMCDRLHLNTNYLDSGDTDILSLGKDIESKCNAILSKLKLHSDNDLPADNNKTPSVASLTSHATCCKKHVNHKQSFNRLSMYAVGTKVAKNNFKQRTNYYRQKDRRYNSTDRHKGASNESISIDQPYSSPVTLTSSKGVRLAVIRKNRTYAKDEDIKTMMDTLPIDSDNASNFESQEKRDMMLMKRRPKALKKYPSKLQDLEQFETLKKIVADTSTNGDDLVRSMTTVTEEHLSNLVPVIADFMSFVSNKQNGSEIRPVSIATVKTLMEFLQWYQCPKSTNTNRDICDSSMDNSRNCEHHKTNRISSEMRKNTENMRLICISSMENTSKVPCYCDVSCQANCENLTEASNFETKVNEEERTTGSLNNIDLIVSKETEMNFLRYRREYQQLTQSIPMYSSNTQNKPWDIVAWISDKLVDELITEIATELQIDDVIQKLYELEFQEF